MNVLSQIQVDLNAVKRNYLTIKSRLPYEVKIMAVVKNDAYGHGLTEVSKALFSSGCRAFVVANVDEGLALKSCGINADVLVLGYTPADRLLDVYSNGLTQSVLSPEYARILTDSGLKLKVHVAIDTGMNRVGLDADNTLKCINDIKDFAKHLEVEGVFTHLCVADDPMQRSFTVGQIDRFRRVVEGLGDLNLKYIHCMNSAGALTLPPFGNAVRLGIVLYGLKPNAHIVLPPNILPAMTWKTSVCMVKTVKKGESVGYGRTFIAEKDTRIATVCVGYGDGYPRALSSVGQAVVNGKRAKIVGRVCMNHFMLDVTDIPFVTQGDAVTLIGDGLTADELADKTGSIGYEMVCNAKGVVKVKT